VVAAGSRNKLLSAAYAQGALNVAETCPAELADSIYKELIPDPAAENACVGKEKISTPLKKPRAPGGQ
jgi:hypothetical protein